MLADLFHAAGETTGARTQGSSEAIMLGGLSLKWNWRRRREAAGESTANPNLVFGGDVHVVWEKFCRYFDVEPRIVPLQPGKHTIGPDDVRPHIDENTIGVAAVLGTTFTGHKDDVVGINNLLLQIKAERGIDVPLHVDGASGGFVWPFLCPDSEWDFRLEQVHSINVSGHKFGLVYPGIGWLIFRQRSDLAQDLVFEENYLGKTDATFTLNFSTGLAGASADLGRVSGVAAFRRPGLVAVLAVVPQPRFHPFDEGGQAVAVPLLQGITGEGVTGAPALIGQHGDLVHQVWMLRPTGGNGIGGLPDVLGDQPLDNRVQPQPQLLPQLRGTAARRLPRSRQQPRITQSADLLRAAGRDTIKFAVRQRHQLSGHRERLHQQR
jgi:Pyridoxal-dependent decarboxylase conserved domain